MARRIKSPGGHPPIYTGKGRKGTGLGYHGKPGNATTPAKGMGYHGKPPTYVMGGQRIHHPGGTTPKPPAAKMKRAIKRLK
jgi:hypothetical protein